MKHMKWLMKSSSSFQACQPPGLGQWTRLQAKPHTFLGALDCATVIIHSFVTHSNLSLRLRLQLMNFLCPSAKFSNHLK